MLMVRQEHLEIGQDIIGVMQNKDFYIILKCVLIGQIYNNYVISVKTLI